MELGQPECFTIKNDLLTLKPITESVIDSLINSFPLLFSFGYCFILFQIFDLHIMEF